MDVERLKLFRSKEIIQILRLISNFRVLIKLGKLTEKEQSSLRQLANLSSKVGTDSETPTLRTSSDVTAPFKTVKDLQQLMMQKES